MKKVPFYANHIVKCDSKIDLDNLILALDGLIENNLGVFLNFDEDV